MKILIFKTNIQQNQADLVKPVLNSIPGIERWSIDHEDCDKVLRVESQNLSINDVVKTLSSAGFHCEEMTW